MSLPLDPRRLADHVGSWLAAQGPEGDVVVSCRIRLARNVAGYPFVERLPNERAEEVAARLETVLVDERLGGETIWVEMAKVSAIVRLLLSERHLISRDLAPADPRRAPRPGRGVAFAPSETVSVMVNEEDHLRLQGLASGFDPRAAWERVRALDQSLGERVGYATSPELGYLTSCPTNVGTGLRASVMLHLPALGLVRQELEKVFHAAQRTGLAVRGMYGEGSRAAGDLYQISNQVTLGCEESRLIADLEALVPSIIAFERTVRQGLLTRQRRDLENRIQRSRGMLLAARSMTTEVALMHVSNLRLGAALDLVEADLAALNPIAVQVQRAHVHALASRPGEELAEPTERDRLRAAFLRRRMGELLH